MSMNNYSLEYYGLVVTKEKIIEIMKKQGIKNTADVMDYATNTLELLYESSFTGGLIDINDSGTDAFLDEIECSDCEIYYMPTKKHPTLFSKAYENIDEIISEFKITLSPELMGEDFDYRKNFRHIVGTYFG